MIGSDHCPKPIRVLVADDSAVARTVVSRALRAHAFIEVCGIASNGLEAVEQAKRLHPDVISLDVDMPVLDGIQALQRIMQEAPCPVLMVSSLTLEGAEVTIEALQAGAFDYVPKEDLHRALNAVEFRHELIDKIEAAAKSPLARRKQAQIPKQSRPVTPIECSSVPEIVVIGTSTGGPGALQQILTSLPADLPVPVVVVQHMPPGFTAPLAKRLNTISPLQVREAKQWEALAAGNVYIAPAGRHTNLAAIPHRPTCIHLSHSPEGTLHKPSVDVTMTSVAQVFGSSAMGIILTGMGCDGLQGMTAIRDAGGLTLGQDEASCAVFGMPKSCAQHGVLRALVPLSEIPAHILMVLRYRSKPVPADKKSSSASMART